MWVIPGFVKTLLAPPANMFVLAMLGWLLKGRWPRFGRALMVGSFLGLYALSTPLVGGALSRSLQTVPALAAGDFAGDAGAIVVLSGGLYTKAPEYGADTVDKISLERIRYAARLHRQTGLPLLTTGGTFDPDQIPQGEAMANALARDFEVPVRWVEPWAVNTFHNAQRSAAILHAEGIEKIYLVTSATHMLRAMEAFEAVGFAVVPAPTGFSPAYAFAPEDLIPSARGLGDSTYGFYEWIGRLWYRLASY